MRRILILLCLCFRSSAQSFDIASIKASPPPPPNPFNFPVRSSIVLGPDGRLDATQATLLDLTLRAYGLFDFQLSGGPEWIKSARFDIAAKGDAGKLQAMLRSLLADRFQLRVHSESRDLPIFRLTVARKDRKLGEQLHPSTVDCAAVDCTPSFKTDTRTGSMTIQLRHSTMADFARVLISPDTRRVVRDGTELTGTFDLQLTFAPEPLPGFPRLPGSENGTSLFTALREQLGLSLEADRGPVEVMVIDSAERPGAN